MPSVHQCPCCPLRFTWKTELEHHLRDGHLEFHTGYAERAQVPAEPGSHTA